MLTPTALALKTENESDRRNFARDGFTKFTSNEKEGDTKPDIIALVDASGNVVAMHDVPTVVANEWKKDGGKPGEIFHTIAEGTPRGMPAWKDRLTPDQIWQLVSYIESKKAN